MSWRGQEGHAIRWSKVKGSGIRKSPYQYPHRHPRRHPHPHIEMVMINIAFQDRQLLKDDRGNAGKIIRLGLTRLHSH
jgi:hypothetical protein